MRSMLRWKFSSRARPTGTRPNWRCFAGARMVTASETQAGRGWNEARIKTLTGDDPITARFMRGAVFQFKPQFNLWIAGNYRPPLRSVDEAIRRRLNMIPFKVTIPRAERDLKLVDKLKAEWPGILA